MKPGAVRAVEGLKSSRERPRCWPQCPCAPATGLQGERNVPEDLAAYLEGSLGKLKFCFEEGELERKRAADPLLGKHQYSILMHIYGI